MLLIWGFSIFSAGSAPFVNKIAGCARPPFWAIVWWKKEVGNNNPPMCRIIVVSQFTLLAGNNFHPLEMWETCVRDSNPPHGQNVSEKKENLVSSENPVNYNSVKIDLYRCIFLNWTKKLGLLYLKDFASIYVLREVPFD